MAKQLFIKLQTPTIELEVKAQDASGTEGSILVGFKRYPLDQLASKFEPNATEEAKSDLDFFSAEIIYIKNATLEVYEDGKFLEDLVITDTRTAEPNEFFQGAKEALDVLLGYYLNSAPWKDALITAYRTALLNTSFKEAELKN